MKFFLTILVLGVIAFAHCQDAENTDALSQDEVLDIIKESNPALTCINWECRTSCQAAGFKAGYCAMGACNCVAPLPTA